jgi:hypothetical protein
LLEALKWQTVSIIEFLGDIKGADQVRLSVLSFCKCVRRKTLENKLIPSQPLIVVEIVMGYYMVYWGAGVHQWQVTLDQLFHQLYVGAHPCPSPMILFLLLQWANTAQVIYCPLSFLVKMAILLQYLKLFAPSRSANRVMFFGSWITIVATFIAYVIFMFWTLFYCTPRRMIWFKLIPGGKCHDVNDIILAQGAFNVASDIIILFLPTASLWQLSVPLAKKIFITLMFATGLLYVDINHDHGIGLILIQSLRSICHAHRLHHQNRTRHLGSRRVSQRSIHWLVDRSRGLARFHRSLLIMSAKTDPGQG